MPSRLSDNKPPKDMTHYNRPDDPDASAIEPWTHVIPPHQNLGNYSVGRSAYKVHVAPKAHILGRGIIQGEEPLNFVRISFQDAEANVLVTDEELDMRFPHCTESAIKALVMGQRRLKPITTHSYRHLITVACHNEYGRCVKPPQW